MKVVIGVDLYNHAVTGDSSMTLCGARTDAHHIPHVLVANSSGGGIAGTLDSNYYKGCGLRQGIEREVIVVRNGTDRNDCRPPNTED